MMLITRMHMKCGALLLLAAATSVPNSTTEAFTTPSTSSTRASATVSSRTSLHGFMDAFKNDDSLAPVQNAGISGKGPMAVDCKINGKVIKGVVANQRVRDVAAAARVKINYSCEQGSCKTCRIKMNGKQVLACQSKITPKKCDIRV